MKKKRILIIGIYSLIGTHLYKFLKNKKDIFVKKISFEFFNSNNYQFDKIDYIINCSSNKNYIKKKYKKEYDFDYKIAQRIKYFKSKLIFLSSRKIYRPGKNLKENSQKLFESHYSRNKFITENLIKKIIKNKFLILRLPNLLYFKKVKHQRNLHRTYIDIFKEKIKKGILYDNKKIFKDFLPLELLCEIIYKLIKKKSIGLFNVSVGKKIYLNDINKWLNFYNPNINNVKMIPVTSKKKFNYESFYLNNNKLIKEISSIFSVSDVKKSCLHISKKIFYEKK
jgi:dTDP-4-dehydrorhamnose reductase